MTVENEKADKGGQWQHFSGPSERRLCRRLEAEWSGAEAEAGLVVQSGRGRRRLAKGADGGASKGGGEGAKMEERKEDHR